MEYCLSAKNKVLSSENTQSAGSIEIYQNEIIMKCMVTMPNTKAGKWSVGLNAFFLITIVTSCVFVLIFKILNFDDLWWDVTVAISFPASIIALATGIFAVSINKDRSVFVYLSIFVGVCTVLFILLHSLFIND